MRRLISRNERGLGLLEATIAVAILGITAVAFFGGLGAVFRVTFTAAEHSVAQSLAQRQIEDVKFQDWIDYTAGGHAEYTEIGTETGYEIEIRVVHINPADGLESPIDRGMQKITVTIDHLDNQDVIILEDYKIDRLF